MSLKKNKETEIEKIVNQDTEAADSSEKKAELEMCWIDNSNLQDGSTTKGEVKVGILNNLYSNGIDISTKEIEAIIDKYAGQDGKFSVDEYQNLKNDPLYKSFIDEYNIEPWFSLEDK